MSSALRALGFDVYDGAARVVEGLGDPKAPPPGSATAEDAAPQGAPVAQQQQDGRLRGAGADQPNNARRAGDPDDASVGGTVPTGSAQSPEASSSTGEAAEHSDQTTHRSDESPAGEAPAADVKLTLGGLSHMLCFVRLEDTLWLVDCGFGGSAPTQPVAIDGGINIIDAAQVTSERRSQLTAASMRALLPGFVSSPGPIRTYVPSGSTLRSSILMCTAASWTFANARDVGHDAGSEAPSAAGTARHDPRAAGP